MHIVVQEGGGRGVGGAVGVDFGLVSLVIALNVIITASCSAAECIHCCYCWTTTTLCLAPSAEVY